MSSLLQNLVNIYYFNSIQKFIFNCCSQDSTSNSRSDCTITKSLNNNKIDNNPQIKLNKNNNNNNDINGDNNNEEYKGGSSRLPKVERKEDKDIPNSGFRRTKTRHFKEK